MKMLRTLLGCSLVLALACALAAADKKVTVDKGQLVGAWEVTFDSGQLGKGATFEFTKDGKVTIAFTANGTATTLQGDYSVDGAVITITADKGKIKETRTATAFSAKDMETDNSTGGHTKYSKKK